MTSSAKECARVLAIAPCKRGFGFAVLEGAKDLVDWGRKEIRQEMNAQCLRQIATLIERYRPDVIVIEDYQNKACRRGGRIKDLLADVAALALSKKVKLRRVSRSAVRRAYTKNKASNKHQIAIEIGNWFPELAAYIPPVRKPWMSEDHWMSIFVALALALA